LSQDGLARASGLTKQAISNIERGTSHGHGDTWRRLAAALGVTVDELLAGEMRDAPKARTPLPSESEIFRSRVDAASDVELEELREELREERVRLALLHENAPEDRALQSEYLRAVERHQYLGWALAARAREKAERS
jgi:transcriptional regulator with XRE-family HTH domain